MNEKHERDRKVGMSPEEEVWQQSYLDQLKVREEEIHRELNVNVKPLP